MTLEPDWWVLRAKAQRRRITWVWYRGLVIDWDAIDEYFLQLKREGRYDNPIPGCP